MTDPIAVGQAYEHERSGGVYLVLRRHSLWANDPAWRCLVLIENRMWTHEPPGSVVTAREEWIRHACRRLA